MAFDVNSTVLSGTGSTINEANITATGDAARAGVNVGADRLFEAELRIAGAVTGTAPTLDVVIQDSADNSSFTTIATFPQKTATDVGYQDGSNVVKSEVPATNNYPTRVGVRTRTGRPYLKARYTIGGSATPTFRGVSVVLNPILIRG